MLYPIAATMNNTLSRSVPSNTFLEEKGLPRERKAPFPIAYTSFRRGTLSLLHDLLVEEGTLEASDSKVAWPLGLSVLGCEL